MATNPDVHDTNATTMNGDNAAAPHTQDFEKATRGMSHEEKNVAQHAARFGYGPLAHMRTNLDATLPGMSNSLHFPRGRQLIKIASFRW